MTPEQQLIKITPCILCGQRFSVNDALHNLFFFETMVCQDCYITMQARPVSECCFGKSDQYNPATKDCGERCVDRDICPQFIDGSVLHHVEHALAREATLQQEVKTSRVTVSKTIRYPFHNDPGLVMVFRECLRGITRETLERRLVELALPYRDSLRKLVGGKSGSFRWTFKETPDGNITIQMHRKR